MRLSLFGVRGIVIVTVLAGLAPARLLAMLQEPPPAGLQQPAGDPHEVDELAAQRQALGFLGYLDQGRFADSYAYTGMLIRTQIDRAKFAAQIEKTRTGTGALQMRALLDANYSTTVAGAPEGQYVVLHYHTSFANRPDTVETLTLAFAKGYWRVSGYYIK